MLTAWGRKKSRAAGKGFGPASEDLVLRLADLFDHLGDPSRLKLLLLLGEREHAVSELARRLGLTISAVSHQLQTLRRARLVSQRRDGKSILYRLNDDHVGQLIRLGQEHVLE